VRERAREEEKEREEKKSGAAAVVEGSSSRHRRKRKNSSSSNSNANTTMIIFPEQYVPLYEAVKADAYQSDDRKVIVFVSASEADSVVAVRILQVRELTSREAFFSSCSRSSLPFPLPEGRRRDRDRGRRMERRRKEKREAPQLGETVSPSLFFFDFRRDDFEKETTTLLVRSSTSTSSTSTLFPAKKTKTLQTSQMLFQADHVAFSIFPVSSWAEIKAVCASQLADESVS